MFRLAVAFQCHSHIIHSIWCGMSQFFYTQGKGFRHIDTVLDDTFLATLVVPLVCTLSGGTTPCNVNTDVGARKGVPGTAGWFEAPWAS